MSPNKLLNNVYMYITLILTHIDIHTVYTVLYIKHSHFLEKVSDQWGDYNFKQQKGLLCQSLNSSDFLV